MIHSFEIVDFHTHPFEDPTENICGHKAFCDMSFAHTERDMRALGVTHICGSVLKRLPNAENIWQTLCMCNQKAVELAEKYQGFYIPGYHVHPDYVKESCETMEQMHQKGINLIGELVPYAHGWSDYSCRGFDEILEYAAQLGCIVNFHRLNDDEMDLMVKKHPNVRFVAAHPGEYEHFMRHIERMKMSENYYLDLSGDGILRHGMLRHGIDLVGAERFLFGSDFPSCNVGMFIGGLLLDNLITDEEKEKIFSENAKRLFRDSNIRM